MKKSLRFIGLVLVIVVFFSTGSFVTAKEGVPVFQADYPSSAYQPAENEYFCMNALETEIQKNIYGALVDCLENISTEDLAVTMTVQLTIENVVLDAGETFQAYFDSLELSKVANAVWSDHPEFFWFYNFQAEAKKVGATVYLSFVIDCSEIFLSDAALQSDAAAMQNVINRIVSNAPDGSAYDKIVYINDWLCDNNTYNYEAAASGGYSRANTVVSAFLSKNDTSAGPVCQGYTGAFKILCDKLGLNCTVIMGYAIKSDDSREGHAWNYVNLSGNWYAMDVTWNDSTGSNMNVLVGGTSVTNPYWSKNRTFSESHVTEISFSFPLADKYPVLSGSGWVQESDIRLTLRAGTAPLSLQDGLLTGVRNKVKFSQLMEAFERNGDFTAINAAGNPLKDTDYVGTGCAIQLRNGTNVVDSAVVIVRGDLDGDGEVKSADYMKMKKYFSKEYNLSGYAFMAADTDGSGKLETRDYMRIKFFFDKKFDLYQF